VHLRLQGDGLAIIRIGGTGNPPEAIRQYGMTPRDLAEACRLVAKHRESLERAWRELHGKTNPDG
jgi:hypothetical protein